MHKSLGVWVFVIHALACSGQAGERPSVAEAQAAPAPSGSPAQKLITAYLGVQRKLAADDAKAARAAFAQLRAAADAKDLAGDAASRKRISAAAAAGASAKDLAAARDAFAKTSDAVLDWLRHEGNPLANSVRVVHCPMAQNGKGARWVQTESKVVNPYYGSEMLECGSLEKELKAGAKLE